MTMTRTLGLALALVVAGALAACTGLIPDTTIDNAFGLDGVSVPAAAEGASVISLNAGGGGSTQLSGTFDTEVPSSGLAALPGIISVASVSDVITIQAAVGVSAPGDVDFAAAYTITDVAIELRIVNADAPVVDQTWTAAGLSLTFSGTATYDQGTDTTSGTYSVATEVPLVTLSVQGAAVAAYVDALRDGATLEVEGALTVELEPAFPSGAEATFTLKSLGGTVTY
jgi:hypothetical protein